MLSSSNSEGKNNSSKSIILAPFNSTKSNLNWELEQLCDDEEVKEMIRSKGAVKYSVKVKEINRQYEMNNNANLDNGVYH